MKNVSSYSYFLCERFECNEIHLSYTHHTDDTEMVTIQLTAWLMPKSKMGKNEYRKKEIRKTNKYRYKWITQIAITNLPNIQHSNIHTSRVGEQFCRFLSFWQWFHKWVECSDNLYYRDNVPILWINLVQLVVLD